MESDDDHYYGYENEDAENIVPTSVKLIIKDIVGEVEDNISINSRKRNDRVAFNKLLKELPVYETINEKGKKNECTSRDGKYNFIIRNDGIELISNDKGALVDEIFFEDKSFVVLSNIIPIQLKIRFSTIYLWLFVIDYSIKVYLFTDEGEHIIFEKVIDEDISHYLRLVPPPSSNKDVDSQTTKDISLKIKLDVLLMEHIPELFSLSINTGDFVIFSLNDSLRNVLIKYQEYQLAKLLANEMTHIDSPKLLLEDVKIDSLMRLSSMRGFPIFCIYRHQTSLVSSITTKKHYSVVLFFPLSNTFHHIKIRATFGFNNAVLGSEFPHYLNTHQGFHLSCESVETDFLINNMVNRKQTFYLLQDNCTILEYDVEAEFLRNIFPLPLSLKDQARNMVLIKNDLYIFTKNSQDIQLEINSENNSESHNPINKSFQLSRIDDSYLLDYCLDKILGEDIHYRRVFTLEKLPFVFVLLKESTNELQQYIYAINPQKHEYLAKIKLPFKINFHDGEDLEMILDKETDQIILIRSVQMLTKNLSTILQEEKIAEKVNSAKEFENEEELNEKEQKNKSPKKGKLKASKSSKKLKGMKDLDNLQTNNSSSTIGTQTPSALQPQNVRKIEYRMSLVNIVCAMLPDFGDFQNRTQFQNSVLSNIIYDVKDIIFNVSYDFLIEKYASHFAKFDMFEFNPLLPLDEQEFISEGKMTAVQPHGSMNRDISPTVTDNGKKAQVSFIEKSIKRQTEFAEMVAEENRTHFDYVLKNRLIDLEKEVFQHILNSSVDTEEVENKLIIDLETLIKH
eukprot:TRINITY_DN3225_c0_g1_i1.p1 TRINITY_DN3225_c0_g1~~TRINITY_DN3225_c0_g1_i1.p1  ORF type:complete len:794 (-),score=186.26 TRINITY_DN3225_c0_g1_i1:106-2487(-)